MSIRRALLFMPGDDRHKIEKGAALNVDSVIMDLEDGVALNRKSEARLSVHQALKNIDFGHTERLVRINPVQHDLWQADLEGTVEGYPNGYVIPKVESADHVRRVDAFLIREEQRYGWINGGIRLLAIIESARGVIHLNSIASSTSRLAALVFGAEDLASDIGATRTPDSWEVFYGRSAVVIHAKAYGLQAVDTPFVDLTAENNTLIAQSEQALYMGYTGKLAIHPRQVGPIQKIFTPTPEQIQRAKALINAHDKHQLSGEGVFVFEGRMVDMPMVHSAELILERARAAGLQIDSM